MGATSDYTRGGGVSGADRIAAGASTFCGGIMSLTSWNVSTGASTTAGADANTQTVIVTQGVCGADCCVSESSVPAPSVRAECREEVEAGVSGIPVIPGIVAVAPLDAVPPAGIEQPGPPASEVSCRARNPTAREMRLRRFTAAR